jgi:peptide/nickel transport system permease protein
MMRITDAFLAFPIVVGVVLLQQLSELSLRMSEITLMTPLQVAKESSPLLLMIQKLDPVMLALILFSWMAYARLTNTQVLRVKQMDFVMAARSLGAGPGRLIFRHLIPNAISPAIVLAARDIGGMVLMLATLTFIGLSDRSEWGVMLAIGRRWVVGLGGNPLTYWWVFVPLTLALVLFGIGWNLLGDGLNDWMNPRQV